MSISKEFYVRLTTWVKQEGESKHIGYYVLHICRYWSAWSVVNVNIDESGIYYWMCNNMMTIKVQNIKKIQAMYGFIG